MEERQRRKYFLNRHGNSVWGNSRQAEVGVQVGIEETGRFSSDFMGAPVVCLSETETLIVGGRPGSLNDGVTITVSGRGGNVRNSTRLVVCGRKIIRGLGPNRTKAT